ncbi:MAG: phage tail protein [Veillonellaceae bacterium]|nr:phage tail protein [Veillonellaceae bacterium]
MAVTEGQLIKDGTAVWKVKKIGSEVPAGIMQMFAGNTIPAGWLLCDGSAVSRADYAKLFSAIGTTWGAGDGSTTFNLPNSIGRFAEGAATSGSYKSAGLPNITGHTVIGTHDDWGQSGAFRLVFPGTITGVYAPTTLSLKMIDCRLDFNASESNSIYGASTTVQPPSFTTRYIIKY